MASSLVDLVKINVSNTGSGAITLGSPVEGYRGADVLTNGTAYSYSIQQGSAWEFGRGTYLASSNQLVRAVIDSSDGGTPINLKVGAAVSLTALSEDLMPQVQLTESIAADVAAVEEAKTLAETAADTATTKAGEADSSATLSLSSAHAAELIGDQVSETAAFVAQVLASMGRYYASRATAVAALAVGDLFTSNETGTLAVYQRTGTTPFYSLVCPVGYSGPITTSALTMATAKLLGRTTASSGAVEELTLAGLLSMSGGVLRGLHAAHGLWGAGAAGEYISPQINNAAHSTTTLSTGGIHFTPIRPMRNCTIDQLEAEVAANAAGGVNFHLALYPDVNGAPDTSSALGRTTTALYASALGIKNTASEITATLAAGSTYWFAISASGNISFRAAAIGATPVIGYSSASFSGSSWRTCTFTHGQLPATCPTTSLGTAATATPLIRARLS